MTRRAAVRSYCGSRGGADLFQMPFKGVGPRKRLRLTRAVQKGPAGVSGPTGPRYARHSHTPSLVMGEIIQLKRKRAKLAVQSALDNTRPRTSVSFDLPMMLRVRADAERAFTQAAGSLLLRDAIRTLAFRAPNGR